MAIKMKGILAVPGEYTYGETVEVQTAEELKAAADRNPIIPLTFGHTYDGLRPPPEQQIGTVSQKWSEKEQKVLGHFWLYEEMIPERIKDKIANGQQLAISTGYMLDSVDEDGTQRGIDYTHCAILSDDEDPRCPLDTCGIQYRINTQDADRMYRYQQASELTPPEQDTVEKKKEEEAPLEPASEPDEAPETEEEAPKTDTPAAQKTEETDEQAQDPEVQPEPENAIPAEIAEVKDKPYDVIDDKIVWVPDIFKQKEEKE